MVPRLNLGFWEHWKEAIFIQVCIAMYMCIPETGEFSKTRKPVT